MDEYQARCVSRMCSVSSFVRNIHWNDDEKYWRQRRLQNRWQSDQHLRYADDTVVLAETEHELQHLMDIVVQESEQKGLFLRIANSYTMVFSKSSAIPTCQIKVHGKLLEQVNSFVYLGSVFTSDGRCENEVKRRIGIAKTAFTSMKKAVCGRNISMPVRMKYWNAIFGQLCYTDVKHWH